MLPFQVIVGCLIFIIFQRSLKLEEFERLAEEFNYPSADDMFAALGYGEISTHKIINQLKKINKSADINIKTSYRAKNTKRDIVGLEGMLYHISKCCSPIPGEPIVGVVTRSRGISVHRLDCPSLIDIPQERLLPVKWAGVDTNKTYIVPLKVVTQDKVGAMQEVLAKVTDNKTNIAYANGSSRQNKTGSIELGLEVFDIDNLNRIINAISQVPRVISVKRVHSAKRERY